MPVTVNEGLSDAEVAEQSSASSNVVRTSSRDELAIVVNQLEAGAATRGVARSMGNAESNSLPSANSGSTTLVSESEAVRRQSAANND